MGCCFPRIDPTGEHIFVHGNAPPVVAPPVVTGPIAPPPGTLPSTTPVLPPDTAPAVIPALPADTSGPLLVPQTGMSLSPTQVVAPVGSEVVMIATVVNQRGEPMPRERVEWSIAQGGVGQFDSPGKRGPFDALDLLRGLPNKVTNTYVVNATVSHPTVVDRGTPSPADDVAIRPGQAWVSVGSPVEGTSFVTAFAPAVAAWDQRQQGGTIFWVDALWTFPPPANTPVGSQHVFTTTVARHTDNSPLAGWTVRLRDYGRPGSRLQS